MSTQAAGCGVNFHSVDYVNWVAFTTANPTYKMGQGYTPIIIADDSPSSFSIDHIVLRT